MTNTAACKILDVTRRTGVQIRARHRQQTAPPARLAAASGRYLSLRERLQIADLLRLGCSMRRIAAELGRSPSTVKRELDRHRDEHGRYLPQTADHAAREERRRPRQHKLVANPGCACGCSASSTAAGHRMRSAAGCAWTYPDDHSMRLCPETIYRALLVPGGRACTNGTAASCAPAGGSASPAG